MDFFSSPRQFACTTPQTCQHCLLRQILDAATEAEETSNIRPFGIRRHNYRSFCLTLATGYPMLYIPFVTGSARAFQNAKVRTRYSVGSIFHLHSQYFMKRKRYGKQSPSLSSTCSLSYSLVTSHPGYKNFCNSQVCINVTKTHIFYNVKYSSKYWKHLSIYYSFFPGPCMSTWRND